MSSDVVLTSALRTNLLSLQNTQSLIDKTQLRLATGLKVNSALDNPQNFFAADALDNRASDLTRLLDGLGQSIRTIEEADNGITALTNLIDQAQSVVNSARDELASSTGEARLTGSVDLSDYEDLTGDLGLTITGFDIYTTDNNGDQISQSITIDGTSETVYSLAAKITNAFADNEAGEITASVTDEGYLTIESNGGRTFNVISTEDGTAAAATVAVTDFESLGFVDYFTETTRGAAATTSQAQATVVAGNTIASFSLYESAGDIAEAGDLLTGTYLDAEGNNALAGLLAGDSISFTVNLGAGNTPVTVTASAGGSFQDLVDTINSDTTINEYISANFDSATGQLSITSLSDEVQALELGVTTVATAGARTFDIGLGDPDGNLDPILDETDPGANALTYSTNFRFNSSTAALDSLASDYNNIRDQINDIVKDAQYRGVNLLQGDSLTTFFNEDNTSKLVTNGVNFTADGLGLNAATFRSSSAIEQTSGEARDALNDVRNFGSTLANNLSIIQTRQDFTESTINTLSAGADDLTVADQNEEGANLLALQTRQQLGVTSLSLASQSQQAVLRLF